MKYPWMWFAIFSLFLFPFLAPADARFVETPAECHLPYDNADVNNEYKLQGCRGMITSANGGTSYNANMVQRFEQLPGGQFVYDGRDVRDDEAFPVGELKITTTGRDSGTNCTIVTADGETFTTNRWTATTLVRRTGSKYRVDGEFYLGCSNATAQ